LEVLPVAITAILAIFSPFINAYINKVTWSAKTKTVVAMAVSLVIAVAYLGFSGMIGDWSQLAVVAPMVYSLQQLVYNFFVKNIATKFEAVTELGSLVLTKSEEAGKVDVTSDATINATGDNITVDAPVQVSTSDTDPKHRA
jgi:hypothetical protein